MHLAYVYHSLNFQGIDGGASSSRATPTSQPTSSSKKKQVGTHMNLESKCFYRKELELVVCVLLCVLWFCGVCAVCCFG